jgi:hypothetical protein
MPMNKRTPKLTAAQKAQILGDLISPQLNPQQLASVQGDTRKPCVHDDCTSQSMLGLGSLTMMRQLEDLKIESLSEKDRRSLALLLGRIQRRRRI